MTFRTTTECDGCGGKVETLHTEFVDEIWIDGYSELRFAFGKELAHGSLPREKKSFIAGFKDGEAISGFAHLEYLGTVKSQIIYRATKMYGPDELYRFETAPILLLHSNSLRTRADR